MHVYRDVSFVFYSSLSQASQPLSTLPMGAQVAVVAVSQG